MTVNRRRWWWTGAVVVTGGVFGTLVGVRSLEFGNQVASVLALLTSLAGLGVEVVRGTRAARTARESPENVRPAAAGLAAAVTEQWQEEARSRRLQDPEPLPLRWSPSEPHLSDHWVNIAPDTGPEPRLPDRAEILTGHLDEVAAMYTRLPSGRLVVLGEPGAGKTVLLLQLALDLLAVRAPDDPVPVIVELAGWNPETQRFDDWLEERLIAGYPATATRDGSGVTRARALVDQGMVLPLLDGLDELPAPLSHQAVLTLNRSLDHHRPVVLTCRARDWAAVVEAADVLTSAAVVELRPLSWETVGTHLSRTARLRPGSADETRWTPVLRQVETTPDDPVCRTLRTVLGSPLMAGLARAVYSDTAADPRALLAPRYADRAELEQHLLDAFVPAAYGADDRGAVARLAFVARHLQRRGTRDLAWWDLPSGSRLGLDRAARALPTLLVALLVSWQVSPGVDGRLIWLEAAAFLTAMGLVHRLLSYVVAPGAASSPGRLAVRALVCCATLAALGAFSGFLRPLTHEAGDPGYWNGSPHPANLVLHLALLGASSAILARGMGISNSPATLSPAFRGPYRAVSVQVRRLVRIGPMALGVGIAAGLASGTVFGTAQAAVAVARASAHHGLPGGGTQHIDADGSRYTEMADGWRYGRQPDGTRYVEFPRPVEGALLKDADGRARLWDGTVLEGRVADWEQRLETRAVDCPGVPSDRCTRYVAHVRLLLETQAFSTDRMVRMPGSGGTESPVVEWYLALPAVAGEDRPRASDPALTPVPVRFAEGTPVRDWQERAPRRVLAADSLRNAILGDLTVGLTVGLAAGIRRWLSAPADVTRAAGPLGSLHGDRRAALIRSLVVAILAVAFLVWHLWNHGRIESGHIPLVFGFFDPEIAFAVALPAGPICLYVTAWGRFTTMRAWLALTGKLPWRLMAFLADAHERGVLRQAGAVYQFRHARLQERLAEMPVSPRSGADGPRRFPSSRDGRSADRHRDTVGGS
ncbi:NACHT domain-containing protein [Streptomyces clavuligerus]|uniref:NACHT domain-containing protein n=1 Tax=Streptomyces clavuligerus TaxID=1901 RepID=UPI00031B7CAB|nr:NACHT domain-containing protein [Streptomyces clavuligerus]MBY6306460.1 NACHT domain-containing protein [Streptomyces clavuligerus]QPJ91586.1 NACHT domain-containing protein [Streptomyces clavuligerus]QPL66284.1 NACHT domain-containing protein [Streptomyces clavuligerus]QPL71611.1 NACHT domain-containing protein [Streptomyces clavuligerus]QPL78396.1 NACHT domain-containing protein [Streptomyces clavuligerus]